MVVCGNIIFMIACVLNTDLFYCLVLIDAVQFIKFVLTNQKERNVALV